MKLTNRNNDKERDTVCASETSFDAHKLYSTCSNDKACAFIFPSCLRLLYLMLIFPLSTACVGRFKNEACENPISKPVITDNLENFLFIVTEATKTGFTDSEYDFFVDELKKKYIDMRIDVLFISI